jgi:hypothetical protein
MPNDELSISAGIGAFNSSSSPQVYFNGNKATMDENGVGTFTNKVTSGGSVSVVIEYTKPDGTRTKTDPKVIQYSVGQSSKASIALDKMNVFYIGLDNPITVSSPTGLEKTSVTGSNCTVNGSGPGRTVKVTAPGECSITVSPAGSTPLTLPFRIKRIPEPEFKLGSGKPRMLSVEFKNQTACRADMGPDFIYDVKYTVVSATVYFAGTGFPNVVTASINGNNLAPLAQYMTRCVPGTSITFDNVKVQGPDGQRVIEGKTFSLF